MKRDDNFFVHGRLSDYGFDSGKHPQWQQMRELQAKFSEASPKRAWVNSDGLNEMVDRKTGQPRNEVHYSPEGDRIFGERLADTAIESVTIQ